MIYSNEVEWAELIWMKSVDIFVSIFKSIMEVPFFGDLFCLPLNFLLLFIKIKDSIVSVLTQILVHIITPF